MASKAFRIIKFIALLIIGFIAFIFVAAFIVSNEFETERSIVIDRPVDEVFDYILYLENQFNYSVWGAMDPDMRQEFRGMDGTVGFVSAWEGNEEVGSGEQEIIAIAEGERIDYELRFFEPFESTSYAFMSTESVSENKTRVTWGMWGICANIKSFYVVFYVPVGYRRVFWQSLPSLSGIALDSMTGEWPA